MSRDEFLFGHRTICGDGTRENWVRVAMNIPYELAALIQVSEWCFNMFNPQDFHIDTSVFWFKRADDAILFLLCWSELVSIMPNTPGEDV